MRLARIQLRIPELYLEIYFQGCSGACPGCHNPELKDRQGGREVSWTRIYDECAEYRGIVKQLHIVGGEPEEQDREEMKKLLSEFKYQEWRQPIVYFTGKTLEELDEIPPADYIKTGPYDSGLPESKPTVLGFRLASSNQKLVKLR
jgi:organic radical activating enzyme